MVDAPWVTFVAAGTGRRGCSGDDHAPPHAAVPAATGRDAKGDAGARGAMPPRVRVRGLIRVKAPRERLRHSLVP